MNQHKSGVAWSYLRILIAILAYCILSPVALASCDCGSVDANAPCTGKSISTTVSGDNRNVTFNWRFNDSTPESAPALCGQFASGDYWVAPAAGEGAVTVTAITGAGGEIFADENPTPEKMGFLGVSYFHRVSHLLSVTNHDVAENIIPGLPTSFDSNTSLVAAIERNQSANGKCGTRSIEGGCVDAYQVVTILDAVPENAGATVLRPNITRSQKELMTLDDFDLTRLPAKSFFSSASPEGLENIRKVWAHHTEVLSMRDREKRGYSEGGRAFRADLVTDDYAATVATHWHGNLVQLMSDSHTLEEIKPALASMLTYGKDIYYHTYDVDHVRDRWFGVGAGQSLGRFPAAVFFAAMANDDVFGETLAQASATQVNIGGHSVHELDQVNIGANGPIWGDGDINVPLDQYDTGRYWGEMLVGQQFNGAQYSELGKKTGQRTMRDPYGYIDGPGQFPGISYGAVSAGPIRALAAEMLLIPRICNFTNYDPLIEYSLRLTTIGKLIDDDPCAPPDPRELNGEIVNAMREAGVPGADDLVPCDTFRARNCRYYGLSWDPEFTDAPTWGPDPDNLTQCIQNGTDPVTGAVQHGRFTDATADQRKFNIGYRVPQIEQNWEAIHIGRNSCRVTVNRNPKAPQNFQVIEQ